MSKLLPNLFRITSIVIFLQLLLGGLITFFNLMPMIHIVVGFVVFVLAVTTMIVALRSKNTQEKVLKMMSAGLVALIVIQIILGFEVLTSGSEILAWIHFVVALGIYGMSAAGWVMSTFLGRIASFGPSSNASELQSPA